MMWMSLWVKFSAHNWRVSAISLRCAVVSGPSFGIFLQFKLAHRRFRKPLPKEPLYG